MRPERAARELHDALVHRGLRRENPASGAIRYAGRLRAAGRDVEVALEIPSLDFAPMPKVLLLARERDVPGAAAHIGFDDAVCYAAEGSVVLDRYDPGGAALLVLELASRTLADILEGRADADIGDEFPQHWHGAALHVALPPDAPEGPATVCTVPRPAGEGLDVLTRDGAGLEPFPAEARAGARASARRAHLFRTRERLSFPPRSRAPTTFAQLLAWAGWLEPGLDRRLLAAAQASFRGIPSLHVAGPNGCVGADLVVPSLILRSIQRPAFHARVMDTHRDRIGLLRWSGLRMDTEFMFDRNLGGAPGFAGRNIVLVGCGTIGGLLAKFLGQSGAGHRRRLSLVDPDKLAPGNVGRHWLGPRHVGAPKAEGCRDEIKAAFPRSDVRAHACSILEKLSLVASADLVVDATGEEAAAIALNQRLVDRRPSGPAAVHVWLAGNGAAAPVIAAGLALKVCLDWAGGNPHPAMRTIRIDAATAPVADCDPRAEAGCPACRGA